MKAVETNLRRRPDEVGLTGILWESKTVLPYLDLGDKHR